MEQDPDAGRRDLRDRLVGLHLDQRRVEVDVLTGFDHPSQDLGLRQTLADVGEQELERHGVDLRRQGSADGGRDPPRIR
jgi:hypothetical protein